MRAAVMRNKEIVTDTLADPVPGSGEVLVKTLACGICGSDLHMLRHADKMMESMRETGAPFVPNLLRAEHAEADPGRKPRRLDADQLPRRQAASGRLFR
ncbi:MAG: alcohol dehydrogenase [Deltaproteobacteria bacterium]|nr:alcohol dehydrogenase [Deltaproteobacteria bacterium]